MSHEDWDNGSWTSVLKVDDENVDDDEDLYSTSAGSVNGEPAKKKKLFQRDGHATETEGEMGPKDGPKQATPLPKTKKDAKRPQDASGQQEESWKPYQGTKAERIAWGVDKPEEVKPVLGSKRLGGWKEKLQAFGGDDTARASIDARRKEQENRKQQELIDRRTKTIEGYQGKGAVGAVTDVARSQGRAIVGDDVADATVAAGRAVGRAGKQAGKAGLRAAGTALHHPVVTGAATLRPYAYAGEQIGHGLAGAKKLGGKAVSQLREDASLATQDVKDAVGAVKDRRDEKAYQTQLRQMQDAAKKPPGPTDEEQETQVAEQLQQKDVEAQIASGKVPRKPMSQEEAVSLASDYGGGAGKEYIKPPDYQKIAQELREINQKIAEVYDKHSDNEEKFLEERKKILEEQKQLMESVEE